MLPTGLSENAITGFESAIEAGVNLQTDSAAAEANHRLQLPQPFQELSTNVSAAAEEQIDTMELAQAVAQQLGKTF